MDKKSIKEKWADVALNLDFEVEFKMQVSNLGNVRTINRKNEYKYIYASKLRGFRTINRTFFTPRTKKVEKLIKSMKAEISELKDEIVGKKTLLQSLKYKTNERYNLRQDINELEKQYHKLYKNYQNYLANERKERVIVRCWLLHKLVATYFCTQKTPKHTSLIHLDNDKDNNCFNNLKWVTQDELYLYKLELKSNNVKKTKKMSYELTIEKIKAIRQDFKQTLALDLKKLADKYKVSLSQLRRIKNAETWNFVK